MVSNRFEHFIRFLIYEFIMQEFVINRSLGVHVEEKGRGVAFWCSFYTYYSWRYSSHSARIEVEGGSNISLVLLACLMNGPCISIQ